MEKLIYKIQNKWSTVRGAFYEFNENNAKFIRKPELIQFLSVIGFPFQGEQAERVFRYFDRDGDGKVSYQDFVNSIGFEIHPRETLYFRQENTEALQLQDSSCDYLNCWASVVG